MDFKSRDIISIKDFSRKEIDYILETADLIDSLIKEKKDLEMLKGKIMATLFFEPSTRTRLSFEAAMLRLGGKSIGFGDPSRTSTQKGENLADTVRVVENYADVLVIRHPLEGAARLAAEFSQVPVINAGSGSEEHPTQAMLDLYTIKRELGHIDKLTIGLVGDLKYGRAAHSLAYALSNYNINLYLVSPESCKIRREIYEEIKNNLKIREIEDLNQIIADLDVLYMTRIQKERYADIAEYERIKNTYVLTVEQLTKACKDLIVMHPLPRVDEIAFNVDTTKHAKYFKQVWYGLLLRMGLLKLILKDA